MTRRTILVTGGAGFIGSHTAKLLHGSGFSPVVYDNLSTGHRSSVRWGEFVEGDTLSQEQLIAAIRIFDPAAIIHFAASAYVGNPSRIPQNIIATMSAASSLFWRPAA